MSATDFYYIWYMGLLPSVTHRLLSYSIVCLYESIIANELCILFLPGATAPSVITSAKHDLCSQACVQRHSWFNE